MFFPHSVGHNQLEKEKQPLSDYHLEFTFRKKHKKLKKVFWYLLTFESLENYLNTSFTAEIFKKKKSLSDYVFRIYAQKVT